MSVRERFAVDMAGVARREVVPPGVMPRGCCCYCQRVVPIRRDGTMYSHGCVLGLVERFPDAARVLLDRPPT